ncbi:MAG: hypothetical protein ACK40O_05570 [Allosphingosinicella sp.]
MHRLPALLPFPLFALAACGEDPPPRVPEPETVKRPAPELAPPPVAPETPSEAPPRGADAAAVLKRYYALIGAGDYVAAWGMRSGEKAGLDRFSANFDAYEQYRAVVGEPSRPVRSGGWFHVEVPVMITGRMRGGQQFGSTGSVSLRRAAPGNAEATPDQMGWHIYTGD